MKQIQQRYEVMVRFDDFTGNITGMHYAELHGVQDDAGTQWLTPPNIVPIPVALKEGDRGKPLAEIIDLLDLTATATAAAAAEATAGIRTSMAALARERDALHAEIEALQVQLASARKQSEETLASVQAKVRQLEEEKADPALQVLRSTVVTR